MDEDNTDVFKLITSLCEKFHQNPDKVKKSRSKCYEILLGKRIPKHKKSFKDLKGTTDPFCNLLSWQLVLIHDYNLKDHSRDIEECVQSVQECYGKRASDCKNILTFLLSLRNIPLSNNRKLDLSLLPPINEFENFNNLFILPESIKHESEQETVNTKSNLFMKSKTVFKRNMFENNSLPTTAIDIKFSELFNDEGYGSPPKTPEFNIWDTACRLQYSNRRNWENFGYPEPDKECRFLSELGDLSSLWVENLESLYMVKLFRDGTVFNSKLKSRKAFIRDLKYLLVGMASESFTFDEKGEFYLVPGIAVDGITPSTLESYCQELVLSGTCYKALNRMSVPDPDTGKYKYEGYIFMEFCESILRYLKFYSTAVFNIPDSTTYLQFHESTYQLRLQISAIASICKVGPYMESEEVPHGVALLNYLYQKVLNSTQEKVIITLYSFLYPCCQVYFSRFLNQWILEGNINDPYGEFFIRPNCKYISTRGRTYWTRSYTILEDIVPDFLIDLRLDLLNCGRTMNLLKLCVHSSKLCLYLMGKKPSLITCCLTSNHLSALRQNVSSYYLEVCSECGPQFDLADVFTRWHEQDPLFISLTAKKRGATLTRIELERQKITQEQNEKKLEEIIFLKEQYDAALEQKQTRIAIEIEKDIKEVQQNLEIELKRQKLIEDETNKLVEHYSKLCQIAEERKLKIKNHIKKINSTHMDENVADKDNKSTEGNLPENNNSSTESFYSVMDESVDKLENGNEQKSDEIHLSDSMDIINANESEGIRDVNSNTKIEMTHRCNIMNNKGIQKAMDNFEMARRNKEKVMLAEMGIHSSFLTTEAKLPNGPVVAVLSEAQRNKLRVLSSEFGIDVRPENFKTDRLTTAGMINRNKVLGVSNSLELRHLDNERFINRNLHNLEESVSNIGAIKKSQSLLLDLDRSSTDSKKSDPDKPIPMSVDSTPVTDLPHSSVTTPSTIYLSVDTNPIESIPNTAETLQTDEGFEFAPIKRHEPTFYSRKEDAVFSKRVAPQEAMGVSTNCLKLFLHESIRTPLTMQNKLVNNELLRYFINDLNYLQHLISLRDFFFLQDGEFSRNITETLYAKLYDAKLPIELINCRTLQELMFTAADMSGKENDNCQYLSFKINSLPKCFDLGDPGVLDCISLTYKVRWPLNILLPTDAIAKYDEVFKYLLKLNRVSWVLKKIFLELKILAKEIGKKEIYLMTSPQYKRLHQCRHVMTHFIQTLQNYIVGEVLQSSWKSFENTVTNVTSIDELYAAHTSYIKNILFMCLLNQKNMVLKNVIHKIFIVILKFFDYLRSRSWTCLDGAYVHPNFNKLDSIFKNFEEFVLYLFKIGQKVAKSGYQPHLIQLLDMLDHNAYYSQGQH